MSRWSCAALMSLGLLAGCATSTTQASTPATGAMSAEAPCSADKPALMIISGRTLDRARMAEYTRVLTESGLYAQTGGVYLNSPRPSRTFEGAPPHDFVTLVVRFPTECAAIAFWTSDIYQNRIKPLRENPSAGDYLVTVYQALPN